MNTEEKNKTAAKNKDKVAEVMTPEQLKADIAGTID